MDQDPDPQPRKTATWKHLFAFTEWKHLSILVLAVVTACICAAVKTGYALILGQIFQVIADYGSGILDDADALSQTSRWCVILCCVGLGALGANASLMSSWILFGEFQARQARQNIFQDLLHQRMSWYDCQADGTPSILVRVESQIRDLQMATSQVFGFLLTDIFSSIACIAVAFALSAKLTLFLIMTAPMSAAVMYVVNRKLGPAIEKQRQHLDDASKQVNASVSGINLVKIYNGFNQEVWQYHNTIKASKEQHMIQAHCHAIQISYMQCWISCLFVGGFWVGLWLVTLGANAGQILTTFYATLTAFQGIANVIPQWLILVKGMSAGQHLKQTTGISPDRRPQRASQALVTPETCHGDIKVKEVTFAYSSNPQHMIFSRISLHFPAGQTCFVVGKSGAGKSTLGSLLVNFYDTWYGDILVDGRNIDTLDKEWLRRNVTLVQQSSVIFQGTLRDNVTLGHPAPNFVSMEEVKQACDMALLQSTIATLDQGLDTLIDSVGSSLSGGQKQRLAIARARVRDPPVLIFDEATSGLDQFTKQLVMEAVRCWRKDKTTIIITHDLSQIADNDFVYVLENREVIQQGTRKTLSRARDGLFARMDSGPNETCMEMSPEQADMSMGEVNDERTESQIQHIPIGIEALHSFRDSRQARATKRSTWRNSMELTSAYTSKWGMNAARPNSLTGFSRALPLSESADISTEWESIRGSFYDQAPSHHDSVQAPNWSSIAAVQIAGDATRNSRACSTRVHRQPSAIQFVTSGDAESHGTQDLGQETNMEVAKPSFTNVVPLSSVLRSVWPNLSGKNRSRLVVGLFSCVIAAGCNPAFSYCFARLLATFWEDGNRLAASKEWVIYMIIIAVISGASMYLERYAMEAVGQAWICSLRLEGLKRILQQPKAWFDGDTNSARRISESLDRDAEEMRNLVSRFVPIVLMVTVMVAVSTLWALTISWKLTLVAIATTPIILATVKILAFTSANWDLTCDEAASKTASFVRDVLVNIRVTRAFTLEKHFSQRHAKYIRTIYDFGSERGWRIGALFGLNQSMNYFVIALVFYYGIYLSADQSELSPASLQQVVNLLLFCVGQAGSMVNYIPQLSVSQAAASRMIRLATLPFEKSEADDPRVLSTLFPINMRNLEFSYPSRPEHQVLHNISLQLDQGTYVAIVGPSGCGKSTILSLLLGIYQPSRSNSAGQTQMAHLTCAGVEFNRISKSQLCSLVSYVPQTPFLFPTSVSENIVYGLADASDLRHPNNLQRAAQAAGIHDFIISLPQGYNTMIGDGGQDLSGGQAQRICIARAIVRRPRMLIMDEPTSALDGQTADFIRQTIGRVLKDQVNGGTSVIVVTHNREMMRMADRIIVMEEGQVVEEGGYDELQLRGSVFPRLIEEDL
ncbi:ABC transporter B family member 6 [Colletotrichum tropicale]|nr:ABC transporter B family member 6 [Colletotrichum tropicale]